VKGDWSDWRKVKAEQVIIGAQTFIAVDDDLVFEIEIERGRGALYLEPSEKDRKAVLKELRAKEAGA
jgi:hypothetical protein